MWSANVACRRDVAKWVRLVGVVIVAADLVKLEAMSYQAFQTRWCPNKLRVQA